MYVSCGQHWAWLVMAGLEVVQEDGNARGWQHSSENIPPWEVRRGRSALMPLGRL